MKKETEKYWGISMIVIIIITSTIICYLIFAFSHTDLNITTWTKESRYIYISCNILIISLLLMIGYLSGKFGNNIEN